MEAFHTIATAIALVVLLMAVLRHRQHPIPGPLLVGALLAPVGMLFSLAELAIGTERIDALLAGDQEKPDPFSSTYINDTPVSETYFLVMQAFNLVGGLGLLLVAVGFLLLLKRIIRDHASFPAQP